MFYKSTTLILFNSFYYILLLNILNLISNSDCFVKMIYSDDCHSTNIDIYRFEFCKKSENEWHWS